MKVGGDGLHDGIDGDWPVDDGNDVLEGFLREWKRHFLVREGGRREDAHQGALQLPNVAANIGGDILQDLLGDVNLVQLGLLLQNGHLCLVVGPADIRNEAPLEP